jgi:hypothetical protein
MNIPPTMTLQQNFRSSAAPHQRRKEMMKRWKNAINSQKYDAPFK